MEQKHFQSFLWFLVSWSFGFDNVHKHLYYEVHCWWFFKCHCGTSNNTHNVKCMFYFPWLKVFLLINSMFCLWMWYKVIVCGQIPNMRYAIHVDAWVTHKLHVGKNQMQFVWCKKNWVIFMLRCMWHDQSSPSFTTFVVN